jgi:hypothetical protein
MVMKNPATKELYDFVDGVLPENRRKEIEQAVMENPSLQKEIRLLRSFRTVIGSKQMEEKLSSRFTKNVMDEILPAKQESVLFRILKNSSGIFAMVAVISIIVFSTKFVPEDSSQSRFNIITQSIDSFGSLYHSTTTALSQQTKEYTQPINSIAEKGFGKIFIIGIIVLAFIGLMDDLFGKRYFR